MAVEAGARLETELLARAKRLAEEYLENARSSARRIVDETKERVRVREEREVALSKRAGDRVYTRRVQAAALGFDAELDRLRWTLIQEVIGMLGRRIARFVEDELAYRALLCTCLSAATRTIGRPELVVEMNTRDLKRFASAFDELARAAAPDARIELSREPIDCMGGLVVQSADGTLRVDATFDGRIRRLELRLEQEIADRLFGSLGEKGAPLG